MNQMVCCHIFTLFNALQQKSIAPMRYLISRWRDEINPSDPSTRNEVPKAKLTKKLGSFVDKMADKARLRRARHKGGQVPGAMRKVQVEYYGSDGEEGAGEK